MMKRSAVVCAPKRRSSSKTRSLTGHSVLLVSRFAYARSFLNLKDVQYWASRFNFTIQHSTRFGEAIEDHLLSADCNGSAACALMIEMLTHVCAKLVRYIEEVRPHPLSEMSWASANLYAFQLAIVGLRVAARYGDLVAVVSTALENSLGDAGSLPWLVWEYLPGQDDFCHPSRFDTWAGGSLQRRWDSAPDELRIWGCERCFEEVGEPRAARFGLSCDKCWLTL
jgi:hypothetical protein